MSEIPEDIWLAAAAAHAQFADSRVKTNLVEITARVILAERERYMLEQIESGSAIMLGKALELVQAATAAERERCASLAERDVDWSAFGKNAIEQWDGGPDAVRDYRIGIATGRTIAAAIRRGDAP